MDTEVRCKHGMIAAYCSFEQGTAKSTADLQDVPRQRSRRKSRRFQRMDVLGMWGAIGFLASRASLSIYANDETVAEECEQEYLEATDGEHTIITDIQPARWGHAVSLAFIATDFELLLAGIPPEMLEPATRTGPQRRLTRSAFGWSLIDLGFRVGTQDGQLIRANVPESAREVFERGFAIGQRIKS